MRRRSGMALSKQHKGFLYTIFILLFFSGFFWFFLNWVLVWNNDFEEWRYQIRSFLREIHGGMAMAYLVLLGTLIPLHIKKGWQSRINRMNGAILIGVNVILILSAYGLYYCGREITRSTVSWIHILIGLASPGFIIWHVWSGTKKMNRILRKDKAR